MIQSTCEDDAVKSLSGNLIHKLIRESTLGYLDDLNGKSGAIVLSQFPDILQAG